MARLRAAFRPVHTWLVLTALVGPLQSVLGIPSASAQVLAASEPSTNRSAWPDDNSSEYHFDIAPQSLQNALTKYRTTTGVKLFYDSQLVAGLTSPGVRGTMNDAAALALLLTGTNLYSSKTAHDIVTLIPEGIQSGAPSKQGLPGKLTLQTLHVEALPTPSDRLSHFMYGSLVETAIRDAMQREAGLRQQRYHADIFVWVSLEGSVQRFALSSSTGNPMVDNLIRNVLAKTTIQQSPPSDLPQPLHIRIRGNG